MKKIHRIEINKKKSTKAHDDEGEKLSKQLTESWNKLSEEGKETIQNRAIDDILEMLNVPYENQLIIKSYKRILIVINIIDLFNVFGMVLRNSKKVRLVLNTNIPDILITEDLNDN